MTVAVAAMQLENELKLVEDDLGSFIQSQRNSLLNEKIQLERNKPNDYSNPDYSSNANEKELPSRMRNGNQEGNGSDGNSGGGLNLGGYEQKQRQLRNERHNEYKLYLEEQSRRRGGGKTIHFIDMDSNVNGTNGTSPRNMEENRKEYKSNIDKEYQKLLNDKKKEESFYNHHAGVDDVSSTIPHNGNGKKIIEFDDSDDELFNYVLQEKQKSKKYHRSTSGDSRKVRRNIDINDGRSSSVPPRIVPGKFSSNNNHENIGHTSDDYKKNNVPLVFGGPSHSDLRRERNVEYKKALEDQIKSKNYSKTSSYDIANGKVPLVFGGSSHTMMRKEKELEYKEALEQQIKEKADEKMKEKLKRMGKLKSDTDLANNSEPSKKDQLVQYSKQHVSVDKDIQTNVPSNHTNGHVENTMFTPTNQNYPVTTMYNPMMNYPMGWPAYGPVMPNGFVPGNMVGFQQLPVNMQQMNPHGNGMLSNVNDGYIPSAMDLNSSLNNNRKHSARGQSRNSRSRGNDKDISVPVKSTKSSKQQVPSTALTDLGLSEMTDAASKKEQQKAYQEELKKQMEIKKAAAEKEKKEREKYELKLEQEIATYDPWGKSGCGAPVRNKDGRVVADLKKVLKNDVTTSVDAETPLDDPSKEISPLMKALQMTENTKHVQIADNSSSNKPGDDSSPYSRGAALKELQGNTVLSPRDKLEQNSYKEFLKQQVEEKKRKDEELKEKARLEEEKENRRLQEQQQRMREEYEQEKEKQRKKAEEVRQQNEALSRIAEQKKIEEELKRKKIEDDRDEERRRDAERKLMSNNTDSDQADIPPKSNSPPVPAIIKTRRTKSIDKGAVNIVRNDLNKNKENENNADRNVVANNDDINNETMEYLNIIRDSLKHKRESEAKEENIQEQKDLIHQLSALRKQLMRQEIKVQSDLQKNKKKYNNLVSDFGDDQEKPMKRNAFDRAARITSGKKRIQIESPTQYDGISYENVNGYKKAQMDLDTQQQEYMKQQEKRLAALRQGLLNKAQSLPVDFKMDRQASKQSLLESDSKFISVENNQEVATFPKKNSRNGPRMNQTINNVEINGHNYLQKPEKDTVDSTSLTSLQVQDIARKNDERLANLKIQDIAEKNKGRLSNLEEQDNSEDYLMQNQQYDIP